MVSGINSPDLSSIEALMAAMYQKMNEANTDGINGLSQDELSSISTGSNSGASAFLQSLSNQFAQLDSDGNGELTGNEISSAIPPTGLMGPPPWLNIGSADSTDSTGAANLTGSASTTSSTDSTSPLKAIEGFIEKLFEQVLSKVENSYENASSDGSTTSPASSDSSSSVAASIASTVNDLASADTSNNSGEADFVNGLISNFSKYDTDGNGELSQNEIAAAKTEGLTSEIAAGSSSANNLGNTLGDLTSSFLSKLLSNYSNSNLSDLTSSLSVAV